MFQLMLSLALAAGCVALGAGQLPSGAAGDWPQWRGPERNGRSSETGLLSQWPQSGPPKLWSVANVGAGYGSVAVSGDRVFVQGSTGRESGMYVLSRTDGKLLWSKSIGAAGSNGRGPGPRGTPTVDDDRVYVLTENGDLACFKVQDGTLLWQRNILKEFRGPNPQWLISESPLVDGARVIVTPGGRNAGMVALDKMTGKTVWASTSLSDQAGYASAVVADVHGVRTIMTLTADAAVGIRAADGLLMWKYTKVANNTANIATPVTDDDKVFFTSSYDTGGALLGLTNQGGQIKAEEIYFTRNMMNHHGGVVLVGGYLYGFHNSILTCLEFATGKVMWRDRSVGKGSLVFADGQLYLQGEGNVVGLADASPAGYREKGRFKIEDRGHPSWAHPVVSGGRLFIRNQETLTAYNVRGR